MNSHRRFVRTRQPAATLTHRIAVAAIGVFLCVTLLAAFAAMPGATRTAFALAGTPRATSTPRATTTPRATATPRAAATTNSAATSTRLPTRVPTHTPVAHAGQASPRGTSVPTPRQANDGAVDEAQIAAGLAIYLKMGCGGCHHLTAARSVGVFGPSHDHIASTAEQRIGAADYQGNATTAREYIRESIVSPDVYEAPEFRQYKYAMPTFSSIPDADLDALVAFLMQQR